MAKFTLIYRDLTTGLTGWYYATGEDLGTAHMTFEAEEDNLEVLGAFEDHIKPLWWEE
jgi:hypothetical protein